VSRTALRAAAEIALNGAQPQSENAFKIELATRCLTQALVEVTA
jgi:xanthine dehydrogenase YagS FAD-binding subunit